VQVLSVSGSYEFVRPGSLEKSTETIILETDSTCTYHNKGESSLETYEENGTGTYSINNNNVVIVMLHELVREQTMKYRTGVKGIQDGTVVKRNVSIPISVNELVNAPKNGMNKWRRKN